VERKRQQATGGNKNSNRNRWGEGQQQKPVEKNVAGINQRQKLL